METGVSPLKLDTCRTWNGTAQALYKAPPLLNGWERGTGGEGAPNRLNGRQRVRAEEATDSLRLRSRAAEVSATGPLPAEWWNGLGPETRRVLIESGIERRRQDRLHEVDVRTREVERTIERREAPKTGLSP